MLKWRFWDNGPQQLTESWHHVLMREFMVDSNAASKLRYLAVNGKFAGRLVHYVCVFDPAELPGTISNLRYKDVCNQTAGVHFTGRIERDGYIFLTDRRETAAHAQ